jgi:hypothetical protein
VAVMTFDPRSARSFPLWAGILVPPLAWAVNLVFGDAVYELFCTPAGRGEILGVGLHAWSVAQSAVTAAITVAAGLLATRAWRQLQRITEGGREVGRARAMALAGMASSLIFVALITFGFFVPLFLDQCATSL